MIVLDVFLSQEPEYVGSAFPVPTSVWAEVIKRDIARTKCHFCGVPFGDEAHGSGKGIVWVPTLRTPEGGAFIAHLLCFQENEPNLE